VESTEPSEEKYELLWVSPAAGATNALSLDELEDALDDLYAHIEPDISLERRAIGQTAVRLFGHADKVSVLAKLAESRYGVVEEETRLVVVDEFAFANW
jgi:hypothetical protein